MGINCQVEADINELCGYCCGKLTIIQHHIYIKAVFLNTVLDHAPLQCLKDCDAPPHSHPCSIIVKQTSNCPLKYSDRSPNPLCGIRPSLGNTVIRYCYLNCWIFPIRDAMPGLAELSRRTVV